MLKANSKHYAKLKIAKCRMDYGKEEYLIVLERII